MIMKKIYWILAFVLFANTSFGQTTYSDIKQILINNCASCHRQGGGGPFDILDYDQAFAYRYLISHEVNEGYMPPWQADTSYMHFVGEREISESDKNAIIAWVTDGGLRGDSSVVVEMPNYPESLLNGIPDLELQIPTFQSNAITADAYNTIIIPTGLTEDRIVRAVEIVPENPELTHHVIVNADEGGAVETDLSGTSFNLKGEISIGTYAPGTNPIVYPNSSEIKLGVRLPAGSDLVLQVHTPAYFSGGLTEGIDVDLKVKIFFYPRDEDNIRTVYNVVPLQYWEEDFVIPAGEKRSFSTTFPVSLLSSSQALSIYSAFPHSHQICTDIINYAYKGTDTIDLIKIDGWDFEHQENYFYQKMVKVPSDYTLKSVHDFDNTVGNHHNPFSPPQTISVGFDSNDEMIFDGFQILLYEEGDELINIDSILNADPLLNYDSASVFPTGLKSFQIKRAMVYPNPVLNNATVYFNNIDGNMARTTIRISALDGRNIEVPFQTIEGGFELETTSLEKGTYLFQIMKDGRLYSMGRFNK